MELNKLLTIIIPCKNEKEIIQKTLDLLNFQSGLNGVQVIVCDSSDDGITHPDLCHRLEHANDRFDLYLSHGGLPSTARNIGFQVINSKNNHLIKTPYLLFCDADVFILDPEVIKGAITEIHSKNLDLVTVSFRSSDFKFNWVWKVFNLLQTLSKWTTPFCLGGFMMVRTETFEKLGGFDQQVKVAEDYQFSKQIKPSKFKRINKVVFTPSRRFENKGIFYMSKLFLTGLINHKNKSFFHSDRNYW
jgi:glycosyltransferase involved in cell wall biosynthesis